MSTTLSHRLADLVMLFHFAFVLFVIFGGLVVAWRPRIAWAHIPCALYGAAIEFFAWTCPLTPIEQALRRAGGGAGYEGGFIEHYVGSLVYPGLGDYRILLGIGAIAVNLAVYAWVWRRLRRRRGGGTPAGARPADTPPPSSSPADSARAGEPSSGVSPAG